MLRGRGIADRATPALPAIRGTMHAALIRGPQLSALHPGAEQRRDGAGWLRPAVAHALPTPSSETPIQPAIRAASHVRGVRAGRRRDNDDLRLLRIDCHATQVTDVEADAGRAPRGTAVVTLEIPVPGRDAQCIGRLSVNGEVVGVPPCTRHAG